MQGDQFDAVMNYIQTAHCVAFFGARTIAPLWMGGTYPPLSPLDAPGFAQVIEDMLHLYDWEITTAQMNLLSSHDMPRFLTMVGGDQSALKLAMLFQMAMPGTPTVYYGDEIGLTGGYDPGSRGAMPWDPAQWNTELLEFVRAAIRLRKGHHALRRGMYHTRLASGDRYAFERVSEQERLIVAFNTSTAAAELAIELDRPANGAGAVFGEPRDVCLIEHTLHMTLPARAGAVIALQ